MIFRTKRTSPPVVRPRITPDPNQAAELQRRMSALAYHPENGFHKDLTQSRHERPMLRLAR